MHSVRGSFPTRARRSRWTKRRPGSARDTGHRGKTKVAVIPRHDIADRAIVFRLAERAPSLSDVVRVVGTASRLLRYYNVDECIEIENAAVLALAKKRQLVS